jgi:hypothetical protein
MRLRRVEWLWVWVLLLACALVSTRLPLSLSPDESQTAWQIDYDVWQSNGKLPYTLSPREILGVLRDDLQQAHTRLFADGLQPPLYPISLNLWALLTGENALALRWYSVLWGLIALALVIRLCQMLLKRHGLVIGVAVGVFVFWQVGASITPWGLFWALCTFFVWGLLQLKRKFSRKNIALGVISLLLLVLSLPIANGIVSPAPSDTDWQKLAQEWAISRPNDTLLITIYPPTHPLAHYERTQAKREGITLNLGWRNFTSDEIQQVLKTLANTRSLWIIASVDHHNTQTLLTQLVASEIGITQVSSRQYGDVIFNTYTKP